MHNSLEHDRPVPWFQRPTGWLLTLVIVAVACITPAWLMFDRLDGFCLKLDDFAYVAKSRTRSNLVENLMEPHNAHVVPLFRLLTYGLVKLSGGLTRLQDVLLGASYGVLVATLLATGLLVGRETGNVALGLSTMVALGLSSVLEPVVTWYSASQALWAAFAVVLMLLALQAWTRTQRIVWPIVGGLAAFSAPLLWSGGYVAGPSGLAYLLASRRRGARRGSLVPLAAVLLTAFMVSAVSGRQIAASETFAGRSLAQTIKPVNAVIFTAQAIPEVLVLRNFGVNVLVSGPQGVILCAFLAIFWACNRGIPFRVNALEAAGAAMAVFGYLLVFSARGNRTFDSLRGLGWYNAIPQVGAVLFVAGWWGRSYADSSPPGGWPRPPTRGAMLVVLMFVTLMIVIHKPLIKSTLLASVYPPSESELKHFPTKELQLLRARYLAAEFAGRQQRFLARLDAIQQIASQLGVGRKELRGAFGQVIGPGMPANVPDLDIFALMEIPQSSGAVSPSRIQGSLSEWVGPEPEPRPTWLSPTDAWPPAINPR